MKLNAEQVEALARQALTAVGMLFVTYDLTGNENIDAAIALLSVALTLLWSCLSKSPFKVRSTLMRKAIQALPAFITINGFANEAQATALTAIAFSIVSIWDITAKKS